MYSMDTHNSTGVIHNWNVTTAQIILKVEDDIDALYPTKYIYCYRYQGISDKFWK